MGQEESSEGGGSVYLGGSSASDRREDGLQGSHLAHTEATQPADLSAADHGNRCQRLDQPELRRRRLLQLRPRGVSSGYETKYYRLMVSDRNVNDTVKVGGRDLTYIVRVHVLGPFIQVNASNRGNVTRSVEVTA